MTGTQNTNEHNKFSLISSRSAANRNALKCRPKSINRCEAAAISSMATVEADDSSQSIALRVWFGSAKKFFRETFLISSSFQRIVEEPSKCFFCARFAVVEQKEAHERRLTCTRDAEKLSTASFHSVAVCV